MLKLKNQKQINELRVIIQKAQGNRCALCNGDFSEAKLVKKKLKLKLTACLDHDHNTGIVRGVLCANCNQMEGVINNRVHRASRDLTDEEWLDNLVNYRKLHNIPRTSWIHTSFKTEDEKRLQRNKKARLKRTITKKRENRT